MRQPAYTRLRVDDRRAQLLALGADLFTRYSYDQLSMARIAREAGISKPLLYHYFRSKQAFFQATLSEAAEELRRRTEPDPSLAPAEQLEQALDAFLGWIEQNEAAYVKLMESAASLPEVRALVDEVRERTVARMLAGLFPGSEPPARLRSAALGWLWFMDGVCLDWIRARDYGRDELKALLTGTLAGALTAAGAADVSAALRA